MTAPHKNPFALYFVAVGLAILAACALLVDLPISSFFASDGGLPGDIVKVVNLSEIFAHGFGVVVVVAAIAVLDSAAIRKLPRLVACAVAPGVVVNIVKTIVVRQRPLTFLAAAEGPVFSPPDSVWKTFGGFNDIERLAETISASELRSFPSGHTASAFGLAIGLGWLYPRGRWLFLALAVLAASQRLTSLSHFSSDVLVGAAISFLFAAVCLDQRLLGGFFSKIEAGRGNPEAESATGVDKSP